MPIVKTDSQIQKDVLEELRWDSRVAATDVGVEVDTGVVTLTGTVDSYAKKLAAREAAHHVAGVLDVADDVQIILPSSGTRTDTDIAQAVRHALTWDTFLPEERIQSTVSNGWVILDGQVDHWYQRETAENAIRHLNGIKGITNHLQVLAPRVAAQAVRKSIEDALERRAEREAQRITVQVVDGAVTLSGNVPTWSEERAVLDAAAHAPGAHSVKNELHITPSA